MTYNVNVMKENGCWYTVGSFTMMTAAIAYAAEKTKETGDYHLVEVVDGGKH